MSSTRADFKNQIRTLISDTASADYVLSDTSIDRGLNNALLVYSSFRPRTVSATTSTAASAREYALPSNFDFYFSEVRKINYPATATTAKQDLKYLKKNVWLIPDETLPTIRFTQDLETGYKYKLFYTVAHTASSVSDRDIYSVAEYAAGVCSLQIAAKFARTDDPTLGADFTHFRSKAKEYSLLAETLKKSAFKYWEASNKKRTTGKYKAPDDPEPAHRTFYTERTPMTGELP